MKKVTDNILRAYRSVFARKLFYPFNKALYFCALRGMGIDNWANVKISGEASFVKKLSGIYDAPAVFDVGANEGQFAEMVRIACPAAEIHSFEPHPASFAVLNSKASELGINTHNIALSDEVGELELFDHKGQTGGSQHASLFREVFEVAYETEADSWKIESTTIDRFLESCGIDRIDLLKIDVEGAELKVLQGAQKAIKSGRIDLIQFEYTAANIATRVFMKDFTLLLRDYRFYRMLPYGLVDLGSYSASTFEICGYQNIVAVRDGVDFEC